MRKIFALLFLAFSLPSHSQEHAVWLKDSRQLSCAPKKLRRSDVLTIKLGLNHGHELGIRRHSDSTWYFLVVGSPPNNAKTLMTPGAFKGKRQLTVPASLVTTEWTTGKDVPVFSTSGFYSVYVSANLESETGGYMCTIQYVR